LNSSLTI